MQQHAREEGPRRGRASPRCGGYGYPALLEQFPLPLCLRRGRSMPPPTPPLPTPNSPRCRTIVRFHLAAPPLSQVKVGRGDTAPANGVVEQSSCMVGAPPSPSALLSRFGVALGCWSPRRWPLAMAFTAGSRMSSTAAMSSPRHRHTRGRASCLPLQAQLRTLDLCLGPLELVCAARAWLVSSEKEVSLSSS